VETIDRKTIILAFLAGLATILLPICGALWEVFNDPMLKPDGSVDNGAERGAGVFLSIFVWPLLLFSTFYFLLLAAYSIKNNVFSARRLFVGSLLSCICLALVVSAFFYKSGIAFQVKVFLMSLLACIVGVAPGTLTLWGGHKNA
jgi:hypothetical protein